jgi:hypothetical protein
VALDPDELATVGSADWWLIALGKRLDAQRPALNGLNNYDLGDHPLPQGHRRAREAFRRFQRQARTNFTGLVTESVLDRLTVTGFRMGGQADLAADVTANLIWQDNWLDADQVQVMRDALVMGRSYVTVGPDPDSESGVLITGEDPRQVIHACEPDNRREVRAALKTWVDEYTGQLSAVVYLPDSVTYYRGRDAGGAVLWDPSRWDLDLAEGEGGTAPNPLAPLVPVVPFINRPEKRRDGFGEFEDITDVQDRINQTVLDRLVTGATQAFRQRWATGADIKGQFDPGADLIWWVEDEKAKFGDFSPADLRMFIEAARSDVEHLASVSRTPPYYLLGQMANLSGDALTAAEAGLVAKARRRMGQFGESWEAVLALGFKLKGRTVAIDAETIWADPERRNEAAAADAAVKKQAAGVPWRQLMEDLGYSPQQIDRMEAMKAADAFKTALLAPPPAPPAPPAPPGAPPAPPTAPNGNGTQPVPVGA